MISIHWAVLAGVGALVIWREISHWLEARRLQKFNSDLLNRLAARDLQEYAGATRALDAPKPQPDNTDEWTSEEKEQARDRIPVT